MYSRRRGRTSGDGRWRDLQTAPAVEDGVGVHHASEFKLPITVQPLDLPQRDDVERRADDRSDGGRIPPLAPRGCPLQPCCLPFESDERDRFATPVRNHLVLLQPRHPQDDIVAAEVGDVEVDAIGVRTDAHWQSRSATPLASCGCRWRGWRCWAAQPSAPASRFAANVDETKLPVAPQSTRMTAGREPTNPASLMSALLGESRGDLGVDPRRRHGWCSFAAVLRSAVQVCGAGALHICRSSATRRRTTVGEVWMAAAERTALEGPGSWPESGEFSCPSSEKRFDVVIFSAGLTEKTACRPLPFGHSRFDVALLLAAEASSFRAQLLDVAGLQSGTRSPQLP